MKSFTDLEQSKKLAEILPSESADMRWYYKYNDDDKPQLSSCNDHYFLEISKMGYASKPNEVRYYRHRKEIDGANYSRITHISHTAENLVDACVNMIITLH